MEGIMPKSYTEKERTTIITELRRVAMESMVKKGVKKTTVDELVLQVRIPKGTFYLFYNSKEMLLYDALMQKEEEMHQKITKKLTAIKSDFTIESLVKLLYEFFQTGFSMGVLPLMVSGELDILMRKIPDEIIENHILKHNELLSVLCEIFPSMEPDELENYSAAFRAIFFTATYQREIGECYDSALKFLIKGLVIQMWDKKDN